MTKIAYNACHGGVHLSDKAFEALLDRKGIEWEHGTIKYGEYEYWKKGQMDDDAAFLCLYDFINDRRDPDLIAVIETLGSEADGRGSFLKIRDLPAGTKYYIREHDGSETIVTEDPRTEVA